MKSYLSCLLTVVLTLILVSGCANQTPQQNAVTAGRILGVALDAYSATNGGKTITPEELAKVSDQLNGIAAQAQANIGTAPVAANIAQGSTAPLIGQNVQSILPNTPIDQSTVNTIFKAAALAKK